MLKRLGPDVSVKGQACPAHTPDPFPVPALTIADTPVATAASASAAACTRLISLAQVTKLVCSKLLFATNLIMQDVNLSLMWYNSIAGWKGDGHHIVSRLSLKAQIWPVLGS